jgi:hypothetical protein
MVKKLEHSRECPPPLWLPQCDNPQESNTVLLLSARRVRGGSALSAPSLQRKRNSPEPTRILFFMLIGKGIPEPDELVAEFTQVFLHGKTAFLKNAIPLFDYFIDQIFRREQEIDRNPGLL